MELYLEFQDAVVYVAEDEDKENLVILWEDNDGNMNSVSIPMWVIDYWDTG